MRISIALCLLALTALAQAAAPKLPPPKELNVLATESLLAFNNAVQAKDFTAFHKQIAELWRKEITPEKLKSFFQTFIDQELDLSGVAKAEPAFEPAPKIDSDDVLTLQGRYALPPNSLQFRLKYVTEKSAWKLVGIKLEMLPAGAADVKAPTVKEARALVRESLLGFNQAVQGKSFAAFHKTIAPMWQKQITPEKMQSLFQSFIDGEVDISGVADVEPSFERGPLIDDDGLLQIEGSYPTKPSQVRFKLGYVFEDNRWRLLKINVRLAQPSRDAGEG